MKCVGFYRFGEPEVLEEIEVEDPGPEEGYALIKTSYTSINRLDTIVRKGYPGMNMQFPHILGSDVVGRIVNIPKPNSGPFSLDDRVIVHPLINCGKCKECLKDNNYFCEKWKVIGKDIWGSYSDIIKVPISSLIKPPDAFTDIELASMPLSLSTAWRAIRTLSNLHKDDTVAIMGTSGNVGIFETLISKAMGVRVIGFSRDEKKENQLRRLGVDIVLDFNSGSDEKRDKILDYTYGKGVDAVMDCIGSTLNESVRIVKQGGRVIIYGILGGKNTDLDVISVYSKSVDIMGTHISTKKEFEDALEFLSLKRIKPVIGKVLDMKDAQIGNRLLENSEVFGKIILKNNW